jgi:uncharacterized protein (DUF488 family)
MMKIFTIGFTKKTAEQFFGLLDRPDIKRVVDIRLNNSSQLASYTKSADLRFFLNRILGKDYLHLPVLAPSAEMLKAYRDGSGDWEGYEKEFLLLMNERRVHDTVPIELIDGGCLLCSEPTADKCHRRLVAEHLVEKWPTAQIIHLV